MDGSLTQLESMIDLCGKAMLSSIALRLAGVLSKAIGTNLVTTV
jgi:hypothetical protein